ncbi:MAG: terminase small subunit [Filomicrobium sp.]
MSQNLTPKQEAFAQHYAIHGVATDAYKAAGYSTRSGPKTINEAACRLTKHDKVSARIAELQQQVRKDAEEKFELTVERLTEAYMDIAFADPSELFTWDETGEMVLKRPEELTPRQRRLIGHLQKTNGKSVTVEFRLNDRMKALDALAKRLGFFEVDNAQSAGNITVNISSDDANL